MNRIAFLIILMSLIGFASKIQANTFEFRLDGLPNPSGIENFNVQFIVGDDFEYITDSLVFGDAIPSPGTGQLPWTFAKSNPEVKHNKFVVDAFNGDLFDPYVSDQWDHGDSTYTENNILNGVFFTFEYTGTIYDIYAFTMGNKDGDTYRPDELGLQMMTFSSNGVRYSNAIPLPPSAILLVAGLIGMATIKRKNIKD